MILWKESKYVAIAHMQKTDFCASAGEWLIKCRPKIFKKTVVTLVFKLKAFVICNKFDTFNTFSPGKIEKHDFWDSNNSTNLRQ